MATEMAEMAVSDMPSGASNGRTSAENAGSPSQPSANDANVMPSWQAARYAFTFEVTFLAAFAPGFPSATAISICDGRTRTMANSATTKYAFIARKKATSSRVTHIGMS